MSADFAFNFRWLQSRRHTRTPLALVIALMLAGCVTACGQTVAGPNPDAAAESSAVSAPDAPLPQFGDDIQPSAKAAVSLRNIPMGILKDQEAIWTSPAHMREHTMAFVVPLGLATALAITIDHQTMSSSKLQNTSLNNHAITASNGLLGAFVAGPVLLYGLGHMRHSEHAAETGILAGEAMVDSLVVDEAMKAVAMRERPALDGAKGKFFQTSVGLNSSFPSTHSFIAWSSAAVLASEYDSRLAKFTIYGLATAVSATRVVGREHFPSDVVIASGLGWLVGRYVYHKHHHYVVEDY
jgi:membrane-associated phospholipid phosphatase